MLRRHPPVLTQVWLTTLRELLNDPLGAIWLTPRDYADALAGTSFDPRWGQDHRIYRRQIQREEQIAHSVKPRPLFPKTDPRANTG
jgi:hypothetical protein